MTYTPNTPQGNQQIAATQIPILNNFTYINTAMKIDHAWNGNEIGGQADGSHQKISLPNQATDISSLGTGIASVMYSIGGNIFSYNGTKRPVSGVSGTGTVFIQNSFTTVFMIPADCFGHVLFSQPGTGSATVFTFFSVASVVYISYLSSAVITGFTTLNLINNSLNLQVNRANGVNYTSTYKYIYWPI